MIIRYLRSIEKGRRHMFFLLLPAIAVLCIMFWSHGKEKDSLERRQAFEIALRWNSCLLELDRFSEGYRPPVSSRMFAYAGIAAWESALPGLPEGISCTTIFKQLQIPSLATESDFVLPAALDAAYNATAQYFFPHASLLLKEKCSQLSAEINEELISRYPVEAILASRQYGEAVADAVFKWSATDRIGHQAFLFNFDRNYMLQSGPGRWAPSQSHQMPPLLPNWGKARTFAAHTDEFVPEPPIEFSEVPNTPFFAQAMEVYSLSQPLKEENRWIAEFWSDDFPGVTFSAASRWISISNQALDKEKPGLAVALEVWLKVGLALNDAAVNVWKAKYDISLERPENYIRRNINSDWEPLYPTPPFPAYPSGHAGFAGAASTVLTQLLGENFILTDRSHQGRREFLGKPRTYESFYEMAEEDALSRLLIGAHFRMDCEEGLKLGRMVGKKYAAISLQRNTTIAQHN